MEWKKLLSETQLDEIIEASQNKIIAIFKHSTRCNISHNVLNRLEKSYKEIDIDFYYLDLLKYRVISNQIEEKIGVVHQSPQLILLKNGKAIYEASHFDISFEDISKKVA